MVESLDTAGLPVELSPLDYLMYRREANPRTRAAVMGVVLLDTAPGWGRFRDCFDNASRRVLRMRQKVVVPTLPTAAPRWVVDPDFDLDFHVRRVRVPEPGTLREVFELAEVMLQSPLDIARPLWTATLVEGLADGTAAIVFHVSHAIGDGVGSFEIFAQICDLQRDPPAGPLPPPPIPQHLSPNGLMLDGIKNLPGVVVRAVWRALWGAISTVGRVVLHPPSALAGVVGHARSSVRVMSLVAEPSPVLRQRSLACRSEALDIRLSDLQKAAIAGGGSINDAYLAGLCGGLGRYHKALGSPIDTLPVIVPVSVRTDADAAGGNRVTMINLAAPAGTADPTARIQQIREQITQRRAEPARNIGSVLTPLLNLVPARALESLNGGGRFDAAASNARTYDGDVYVAGGKVLRTYALNSLAGLAMSVVLLSMGAWCTITVRYDRAAVQDEQLFTRCVLEGFDEILALAGDSAPRAQPASFVFQRDVDGVLEKIARDTS
ncbi:wax ester/triacylglycerol synthase family O-acyltransferase [Mycobacterium heckeshornense]|uniref:Diacylglycerol O-acyltransferase n=1 Tax=Mycobacterium heckeshornense TaxID=110505 RepID=A0A2G8B467_9MYCO|nr:wax ester/triacylglycerol synthase family O-acyltransferase [Mycobacterium heckeshornense]KMV22416.1 diacylglycerol O-acyltransferase [Mycobacterium heckeshornense]MCV7034764.1 wax ester/triacylglycerol synthase family O-acyltransferase [Mycobacterium heckeshornense]PIJ32538.1 wax ester/triacylglycerol synthase family O-acyltransferase [Mycobacterium heckeshornense]BCO36776.1 diacylglycerol O-acyltransferase [Mycobacterium heckeshornense]